MAVVSTNPQAITGPWKAGFVLDKHVIKSVPTGYLGNHMQFDTTRSELDELVYQFKNQGGSLGEIVETAVSFIKTWWTGRIDCIIATPSSVTSSSRSAFALSSGIAAALGIPVVNDAIVKTKTAASSSAMRMEQTVSFSNT
jgi:hypothetical protein